MAFLLLHNQPCQGIGRLFDVCRHRQQALTALSVSAVPPMTERGLRGVHGLVELRQRACRALGECHTGGRVDDVKLPLFTGNLNPVDEHRVIMHLPFSFHARTRQAEARQAAIVERREGCRVQTQSLWLPRARKRCGAMFRRRTASTTPMIRATGIMAHRP